MQSSKSYQELNQPRRRDVYDLATGELVPGGRNTVDLKEMMRAEPGRYALRKPSAQAVEDYKRDAAHRQLTQGDGREAKPLARPMVQPGQELRPHHRIQKPPSGIEKIAVIARGIRELNPETDFTKKGLPDRRKLEGKVHFGVSEEEAVEAMELLDWQAARAGGEPTAEGNGAGGAPSAEDKPDKDKEGAEEGAPATSG